MESRLDLARELLAYTEVVGEKNKHIQEVASELVARLEPSPLTPEDIKGIGYMFGSIQRLISEGYEEGLREVTE